MLPPYWSRVILLIPLPRKHVVIDQIKDVKASLLPASNDARFDAGSIAVQVTTIPMVPMLQRSRYTTIIVASWIHHSYRLLSATISATVWCLSSYLFQIWCFYLRQLSTLKCFKRALITDLLWQVTLIVYGHHNLSSHRARWLGEIKIIRQNLEKDIAN